MSCTRYVQHMYTLQSDYQVICAKNSSMEGPHHMCLVFLIFLYCLNTRLCEGNNGTESKVSECTLQITSARAHSSTSIQITWKQLRVSECRDAVLQGYKIRYTSFWSRRDSIQEHIVRSPSTTSTTLTGLDKFTWYSFQLLAYSATEDGPLSDALTGRTGQDAPDCSPQLTSATARSSTSIRVSWTWTSLHNTKCINGELRGYKLVYRLSSTSSRFRYITVNNRSTTSLVVTGLDKYTEYRFQVLAYTIKDGPWSNALEETTKQDGPDCSPRTMSATATSSTSIRVFWTSLRNSKCINGVLRGYKVNVYRLSRTAHWLQYITVNNPSTTSVVVTGLDKYTRYRFQVLAYTIKDGPWSKALEETTKQDAPDCSPQLTSATAHSSTSIRVSWTWTSLHNTKCINGELRGYKVAYRLSRTSSRFRYITVNHPSTTSVVVTGLDKYTRYRFQVLAYTIKDGPLSDPHEATTLEDEPDGAPLYLNVSEINATTYKATWSEVSEHLRNGIVNNYEVRWMMIRKGNQPTAGKPKTREKSHTFYTIHDLSLCAQYSVSVRAHTRIGPGPYSTPVNITTQQPGAPRNFKASAFGRTIAHLAWEEPADIKNSRLSYKVAYHGSKSYWKQFKDTKSYNQSETALTINNLTPMTNYTFKVLATTVCGDSPETTDSGTTKVDHPVAPRVQVKYLNGTRSAVVNITIWTAEQRNGPIRAYQVIVFRLPAEGSGSQELPSNYTENLFNYSTATSKKLRYYITAEVPADAFERSNTKVFTIGDKTVYENKYENTPLEKGQRYKIYERALTYHRKRILYGKEALISYISIEHASTAKSTSSLPAGGLAGILIALIVVLVIIIVVGILFWRRRRNQSKEVMPVPLGVLSLRHHQDEIFEPIGQAKDDDDSRPIPVEEFLEYIASNRDNDFAALKQEYKRAPNLQLPWTVARKTINKNKNRYGNIVSYDHSRVAIKPVKGEDGSDYINASFMHGYDNKPKTYIATQGPLVHTFNDFWSMIWEQKASSIVMLTNLLELGKIKCHQYWPDDSAQYGDITVTNHKTEVFADYVLRTFILSKGNHPNTRRVLQFHFTVWPDKGVPQHATAVLAFRRKVRALTPKDAGPLVVHCSAGVGRTGAFIMIDAMLEQANNEGCVDVFRFIKSLRNDRPNMVQTEDQYVFVYLALNEAISCGNTEIQVHNLRIATQKLSAVDQQHNATGYSLEFKKLGVVTSQKTEEDCDIGETPENTKKNRHPDIIPASRCRVILNTVNDDEGNYINAVFIDAYRDRNAFILTQAPMENTIVDFWRMVMDYKIGTIVMLNNLQEGDEIFPQYWPQDGNEMYGEVQVQSLDSSKKVGFVSRNLQVSRKTTSRTIKHFQHVTWVDKCVPDNPQSILLLLDEVQRSQQKCANAPVLVQCSNGVARSGTFCAIASCLERVKQEQVLDVFQTVKSIRVNRPGAVETLIQYVFCYQIIQKYLDSFNDYDNFNGR